MALYFIFTVDGDWDQYFNAKLSNAERKPDKKTLLDFIGREISLSRVINNKILHFIHYSEISSDFFVQAEFIEIWKLIEKKGGSVGIHCHNEALYDNPERDDPEKIEKGIAFMASSLREKGLKVISYRGGYLAFCAKDIPFLEKNKILMDFSCDPGRFLKKNGRVISDWKNAPGNYYYLSRDDHRKPGNSNVVEIPMGKCAGRPLYSEKTSLFGIRKIARRLAQKSKNENRDIVVYVLSHTYEFASLLKRLKIKLMLIICKRFGKFITDKEALEIISKNERKS